MIQVTPDLRKKVRAASIFTEFKMSDTQHRTMKAFLSSPGFLQTGEEPPKHGKDAVVTFESMEEGFKADKLASVEDETHAKNEYNLAKEAREEAIKAAQDAKDEKETILGDSKGRKADAQKEKEEEEKSLVADTATLDTTKNDCSTTAQQFQERTDIRNGEIEAMMVAVKILEKVTKVRNPDEHEIPAKLMQVALVQTGRHAHHGHRPP